MRRTPSAVAGFEDRRRGYKPRIQAASRSWKSKESDTSLEPPEGMKPRQHFDFSPVRSTLDFSPLEL